MRSLRRVGAEWTASHRLLVRSTIPGWHVSSGRRTAARRRCCLAFTSSSVKSGGTTSTQSAILRGWRLGELLAQRPGRGVRRGSLLSGGVARDEAVRSPSIRSLRIPPVRSPELHRTFRTGRLRVTMRRRFVAGHQFGPIQRIDQRTLPRRSSCKGGATASTVKSRGRWRHAQARPCLVGRGVVVRNHQYISTTEVRR